MRNRSDSESSESKESEKEPNRKEPSTSKRFTNNSDDSSVSSSSESEEGSEAPAPPVHAAERSSTSTSRKKAVARNPLERFVNENDNLTRLNVDEVLSDGDDVCILEVPKTVDASEFLERVINFDRRTKIKLNRIKYVIEPEVEDVKPIDLLSRNLKIIHPISVLRMRQYSKSKQKSEVLNEVESPPTLPDKLKIRHPLFGSDFERKIALDEEIQKKLDITIEKVVKKMKKKKHVEVEAGQEFVTPVDTSGDFGKKKKHKKKTEREADEQEESREGNVDESIFTLLEAHIAKSKKDLKKEKEIGKTSSSDSGICVDDVKREHDHKRGDKKRKRESEGASSEFEQKNNVREAQDGFEYKNKRQHKNSIKEDVSTRKHKKSYRESDDHSEYIENNIEIIDSGKDDHIKRKKMTKWEDNERKQKDKDSYKEGHENQSKSFYDSLKEMKNSKTGLGEIDGVPNDCGKNSRLEKKKKHKADITEQTQESDSFVNNSFEEDTSKKKKTHRRIKEEVNSDDQEYAKEESLQHSIRQEEATSANTSERKSQSSFINSTVIPGVQLPLFEFDVSRIVNAGEHGSQNSSKNEKSLEEKSSKHNKDKDVSFDLNSKKKKKDKKIKEEKVELEESNEETFSPRKRSKTVDSEYEETSSPRKKQKKHIKEEVDSEVNDQTNSLILNLLNKAKSEMDRKTKKK